MYFFVYYCWVRIGGYLCEEWMLEVGRFGLWVGLKFWLFWMFVWVGYNGGDCLCLYVEFDSWDNDSLKYC